MTNPFKCQISILAVNKTWKYIIVNLRNKLKKMKPITYPEDIQCVFEEMPKKKVSGCIFIGNLEAAQNMQTLRSN
jgi:hypothetical protein